jgi:RNA polymerase sigma factor (sigma-70 family)
VRRRIEPRIPKRFRSVIGVDDVMQQTFVDAYRDAKRFEPRGDDSFAAWLSAIAERNLLDAVRMLEAQKRGGDRRRIEPRTREDSVRGLADLLSGSGTSPSGAAVGREHIGMLEKGLHSLPHDYRAVVEMYDLQGRPIEDVARELNRSQGAAFMLRARAHRLLAEIVGVSF